MAEKEDLRGSPEPEDSSYIRTAVTLGAAEVISDWLTVEAHQSNKAEVTDMVLVPAAMYGQLRLLEAALQYGDLSKQDSDRKYSGWTLMHFAVEGAQRVVVMNHRGDEQATNEPLDEYLPANQPQSVEEVRWVQLDIIMRLYTAGAPTTLEDESGDSASDRACRRLEEPFLEGAMLLDILSILESKRTSSTARVETPGLSCIPSGRGWKRAVQQLVEWAYHRKHYEVLQFCHRKKFVELDSPKFVLTSPEFRLRQQRRPLVVDSILVRDFNILRILLTTPPIKYEVLSKMYDFVEGNTCVKRSVLFYACELYQNRSCEEDPLVLTSLLSRDVIGVNLTSVTITGVGLRSLPVVLFHPKLQALDVRENILDRFPTVGETRGQGLGWDCPQLEIINISHNHFTDIPKGIFKLKSLARLVAMANHIKTLPMEMWSAPSLKVLDLSDNQIQVLPCHHPHARVASTFSPGMVYSQLPQHRSGRVFLNQAVPLESIKHGYINYDTDYSSPHRGQVGFGLQSLDLSGNQLREIPRSLPCLAPLLQSLKLARNQLQALGQAVDYPPLLQMLDVKNNGIVNPLMPSLITLTINCVQSEVTNVSPICSHAQHENLVNLKFLYLSANRLEHLDIEYDPPPPEQSLEDSGASDSVEYVGPKKLLFPKLQGLQMSHNQLTELPENIHRLVKLCELAFDNNPQIRRLPSGLHKLTNLFTLRYKGISDPVVSELANIKTTPELLYYLKARETRAVVNHSMRLFVIGHYCKGKSTLLEALKGNVRRATFMNSFDTRTRRIGSNSDNLTSEEKASTVGIELGKWSCSLKRKHKQDQKITFYTWDFAGQEEYYVTHQCLLTNRALYLLVWNVEDGQPGIESLSIWLQNMQARAQGFSHNVIIVGTHLDKISRQEREAKKKLWTELLERYNAGRNQSRVFPKIAGVAFVGSVPGKNRFIDFDQLNDLIYDVATEMKAPKDFSSSSVGLTINILDEKIPQSYDLLRLRIEDIARQLREQRRPPVLTRDDFCERVHDIITTEGEIDTAVKFLHTTTGVVLHFDQPLIADYYIVDPQKWFDLCALVIAPDNVSSLVMCRGRMGDDKYGLLSCKDMNEQFEQQGCNDNISKIIRTFLAQFHIIHQISAEYCLVPSAVTSNPDLPKDSEVGSFPRKTSLMYTAKRISPHDPSLPSVLPLACKSPDEIQLKVTTTGLIYRRFILLPPIASGFWSKLIALFLQKKDFNKLVESATPPELGLRAMGPAHRLRAHIGNIEFQWSYWKTGIILYVGECVALRVNSFQSHEFQDPEQSTHPSIFATRQERVRGFFYHQGNAYKTFPPHYREVIEVVVPEVRIESVNNIAESCSKPLSARILAKALEIVDEVVKSHCEHLCTSGIYSHSDMAHVIPCPMCYGDKDCRGHTQAPHTLPEDEEDITVSDYYGHDPMAALVPGTFAEGMVEDDDPVFEPVEPVEPEEEVDPTTLPGSIFVMTVESIIKETFSSDVVRCPVHKKLEIEHIAPDLVFADLVDVKLDKNHFSALIDKDEVPVARGSFGKVFKNSLATETEGELEVAVKVFDQPDTGQHDVSTEIIRSYSDMRYELNKLSLLKHPYIARFIGVLTNPHSFVLEWAPEKSLEHIRATHAHHESPICAASLFQTLVQVTSALAYLHSKVGIVHQDLRCSNILAFQFPDITHDCYRGSKFTECRVCVKLTDMGISANPLVHRVGEANGFKLLVPECLIANTMSTLTEKVDMFCLGSCLYELMSLRGLPPADISQPEYSVMLQSGKRAQFHAKDSSYPLYLYQALEDCWKQEHYNRPPAEDLCRVLMKLTGLKFSENTCSCQEMTAILLDSYTLHPDKRIARSEVTCTDGKVDICVAMATRDDTSTTIATIKYQDDIRSELALESSGTIRNNPVIALHHSTDGHIFVALTDGSLTLYDKDRFKYTTQPAQSCHTPQLPHGDIVRMFYDPRSLLLVVGFASGRLHIEKCTQGVAKSISGVTPWRKFCGGLACKDELKSMECIVSQGSSRLDIWCGTATSSIEVWSLEIDSSDTWGTDTVEGCRTVSNVRVPELVVPDGSYRGSMGVCLRVSEDQSKMMVYIKSPGLSRASSHVTIMDVATKAPIKSFSWGHSVASVVLSSRKLAMGTYNGEVFVFDASKLLERDIDLSQAQTAVLRAHKPKSKIYSLACIEGTIRSSGQTSVFPAYIGRSDRDLPKDFLVTVGYGRQYTELGALGEKMFKSSSKKDGIFVNIWML